MYVRIARETKIIEYVLNISPVAITSSIKNHAINVPDDVLDNIFSTETISFGDQIFAQRETSIARAFITCMVQHIILPIRIEQYLYDEKSN